MDRRLIHNAEELQAWKYQLQTQYSGGMESWTVTEKLADMDPISEYPVLLLWDMTYPNDRAHLVLEIVRPTGFC